MVMLHYKMWLFSVAITLCLACEFILLSRSTLITCAFNHVAFPIIIFNFTDVRVVNLLLVMAKYHMHTCPTLAAHMRIWVAAHAGGLLDYLTNFVYELIIEVLC